MNYMLVTVVSLMSCVSFAESVSPQLFLQQAPLFDAECAQRTGFKIEPSWQQELYEKLPAFQATWANRSQALILASENGAGRKFSRTEYSVVLTLCKWTPMGDPAFIVSVRPYLVGPSQADNKIKSPKSLDMFVSMTHHELLHSLVDNIVNEKFSNSSQLLEKYKTEHFNVLVHLHLMAIQKYAYESLGEKNLLHETDELYAFIGGDYQRAWEIVGKEGTDGFLEELSDFNSKK